MPRTFAPDLSTRGDGSSFREQGCGEIGGAVEAVIVRDRPAIALTRLTFARRRSVRQNVRNLGCAYHSHSPMDRPIGDMLRARKADLFRDAR
ncbi:hypothetical protein FGO68_gene14611 [Halteria grandinella]|uniref:Uncharacterized protein n=1 Tax=Halteria grandinella TaxID=5974 RepID=A0A8J8SY26_HALGN|nr:hypothetical protein FGO68_gene14611 [Halteria grandinella]